MKILHITDLHYAEKYEAKISGVLKKFKDFVKKEKIEPDCIFFTGDLVFTGERKEDFDLVRTTFLDEILSKVNIDKKNVFFTCGNHDVHRNQEMPLVKEALFKVKSNEDITKILKDTDQFRSSLRGVRNYNNFIKEYYSNVNLDENESDEISDLYSIHTRVIDNTQINILSINTSWRCNDSNTDEGSLLFPIDIFNEAISKMKEYENKILLHHHPLTDLRYFNRLEVKKAILNNFVLSFNGHTHNVENSALYADNNEGLVTITSEASFCNINAFEKSGFANVEVLFEEMKVIINNYRYDGDIVYPLSIKDIEIPIDKERRERIKFALSIIDIFDKDVRKYSKLFVTYDGVKTFKELFSYPLIKNKSDSSLQSIVNSITPTIIDYNRFISTDNFIIYGKEKCGKSILAHFAYLELLESFKHKNIIPIIINHERKEFDIVELITEKFPVNRAKAQELVKNANIKVIIDNYDKLNANVKYALERNFSEHRNHSYFLTVSETIMSEFKEIKIDSTEHENVFIHDLTKKEIKVFTNMVISDQELVLDILNKIDLTLRQLNIPYNYWTVSLFLSIFIQNSSKKFNDNFELIELYVDNVLEKELLISDASFKINYDDLKEFLSVFAQHLISKCSETDYKISFVDFVKFVESYKKDYERFVVEENRLFNILIEKSIFKEENSMYTFRLKGVFEFFVAYYLKDDKETRNAIISHSSNYLAYANELELIAGFNKKDESYVEQIFEVTKDLFSSVNSKYIDEGIDNILTKNSKNLNLKLDNYRRGIAHIVKKDLTDGTDISSLIGNDFMDSEIKKKATSITVEVNSENLEKFLHILSRVYRNSNLKKSKLSDNVFDFIIESSCYLCFYVIENDVIAEEEENDFLKVFSQFIPLAITNFLNISLSQSNLENIYKSKIEEYKKDIDNGNELKLFILYFLLIDLDFKSNKGVLKEFINLAKNNIIKNAIVYKLMSYVFFNSVNDDSSIKIIKENIKNVSISLGYADGFMEKMLGNIDKLKLKNKMGGKK